MNEFSKLMSMKESDFEALEHAEREVIDRLEKLGAHQLCELDNVCVTDDGKMYAIAPLKRGEEIIREGSIFGKAASKTAALGLAEAE